MTLICHRYLAARPSKAMKPPRRPWAAIFHRLIFHSPTWTICTRYRREPPSSMTHPSNFLFMSTILQPSRRGGRARRQGLARMSRLSPLFLKMLRSNLANTVHLRRPPAKNCLPRLPGNVHELRDLARMILLSDLLFRRRMPLRPNVSKTPSLREGVVSGSWSINASLRTL